MRRPLLVVPLEQPCSCRVVLLRDDVSRSPRLYRPVINPERRTPHARRCKQVTIRACVFLLPGEDYGVARWEAGAVNGPHKIGCSGGAGWSYVLVCVAILSVSLA